LALGWSKYVGPFGKSVSIEHFGASADYQTLFREFGMTTEAVVATAKDVLKSL
jgi:transketolase